MLEPLLEVCLNGYETSNCAVQAYSAILQTYILDNFSFVLYNSISKQFPEQYKGGRMDRIEVVNVLKDFISGSIQAEDLNKVIADWLFELRREPDLTSDQELLSNLELYIHEAQEGYRSWDELHEFILSVIPRNLSGIYVRTVPLPSSTTSSVDTITQASPVRPYSLRETVA